MGAAAASNYECYCRRLSNSGFADQRRIELCVQDKLLCLLTSLELSAVVFLCVCVCVGETTPSFHPSGFLVEGLVGSLSVSHIQYRGWGVV